MERAPEGRPWTVYVLTMWMIGGAVWSLITSEGNLVVRLLWLAGSIFLARAIWSGAAWAFTWSFMLASLCAALLIAVVLVQSFLLEVPPTKALLLPAATSAVLIALLTHPATKRFARVEERPAPEPIG